jgi:hypothetical protein
MKNVNSNIKTIGLVFITAPLYPLSSVLMIHIPGIPGTLSPRDDTCSFKNYNGHHFKKVPPWRKLPAFPETGSIDMHPYRTVKSFKNWLETLLACIIIE